MQEFVMKNPERYSFIGVFSRNHRKRIMAGCLICIAHELFGANCLMHFINWHDLEYTSSNDYYKSSQLIRLSVGLVGNLFCYILMTKIGRRRTILIAYLLQIITFYMVQWELYYAGSSLAYYINLFSGPLYVF